MSGYINHITLNGVTRLFEDTAGRTGVAPIESTSSASKAYAIGDYLWYNDILYKVTAAISSGGTIGPGTNVTQVTLSADVKATGDAIGNLNNAINHYDHTENVTWAKGLIAAITGEISTSANGATSSNVAGSIITIIDGWKAVVAFYSGSTYLGKLNTVGGIDRMSGTWGYITGTTDLSALKETVSADTVTIGLVPPEGITITASNAQKYGSKSCFVQSYKVETEIESLSEEVDNLKNLTLETVTKTFYPTLTWTDGAYLNANGNPQENSSYAYTDFIAVQGGDVLNGYMRFCTAYNASKSSLPAYYGNNVNTYTVNSSVAYVKISREKAYKSLSLALTRSITQNSAFSRIGEVETVCNGTDGMSITGDIANSTIEFNAYALVRKGKTLGFYGKVGAFNMLTIGCGTTDVNSARIEIDTTYVKFYNAATLINSSEHHITISNYIYVAVEIDSNALPTVVINTDGGNYKATINDEWIGALPRIYATADADTSLTDCVLTFSAEDMKKNIWYCGDSYMAVRDGAKLPSKLKYLGVFDHINSIGYSGADAENVMPSINKLMSMDKRPKYLVWAIGMNNADSSSAVNTNWNSAYNKLVSLAESGMFELILATIPNTPTINNNFKNAIVRESGFRYVDFADAVQTTEGANTWQTGMLSSDNVHPTSEGAKALTSRLCADFPEIFN